MDKSKKENILIEFDNNFSLYNDFTSQIESLINRLILENKIKIYSVDSRIKEKSSLKTKISGVDSKYVSLNEITDLSGIRIICYFEDDVDRIAKIIEKEFKIDKPNSVDKRKLLDPDRFGYLSLHYVAELYGKRIRLTEYKRFNGLKFEIQIKTMLQHTWAEIEHDLGYKSEESTPKEVRRRFSRLAGLFEIADDEFVHIRKDLKKYEDTVGQKIKMKPESVLIDQASLHAFVLGNPTVKKLDKKLASYYKVYKSRLDEEYLGDLVKKLNFFEIGTVAELRALLDQYQDEIPLYAKIRAPKINIEINSLPKGFSLFHLCYFLIAQTDKATVINYLSEFVYGHAVDKTRTKDFADEILEIYNGK